MKHMANNTNTKPTTKNQKGWTSEALLAEAQRLVDKIDASQDEAETKRLDGCLMAVQETMLARKAATS